MMGAGAEGHSLPAGAIAAVVLRDLAGVRTSILAYPDDESPWARPPGITNSAGTLALHIAGNLRHFCGAILGETGYVRDRDAEFNKTGLTRTELATELDAAIRDVGDSLGKVTAAQWTAAYPQQVAGKTIATDVFLAHLAAHLAYHLGQIDYHRRIVTGEPISVGALGLSDLPDYA